MFITIELQQLLIDSLLFLPVRAEVLELLGLERLLQLLSLLLRLLVLQELLHVLRQLPLLPLLLLRPREFRLQQLHVADRFVLSYGTPQMNKQEMVLVLLHNGGFCNGCITKPISHENQYYADQDKKYYIFY
jgi:hypothetical protein